MELDAKKLRLLKRIAKYKHDYNLSVLSQSLAEKERLQQDLDGAKNRAAFELQPGQELFAGDLAATGMWANSAEVKSKILEADLQINATTAEETIATTLRSFHTVNIIDKMIEDAE